VDGDVEKHIHFERGRPVFAASNQDHDRMGQLLVREGKITREQLDQCHDRVAAAGRRIGEVLVESGFLKRRELLPAVRGHVEDIIYSLFSWDAGTYQVTPGDFAAGEHIRLSRHPAAMILEGVRRKFGPDELDRLLGPPTSVVEITDDPQRKLVMSVADLSTAERKALSSFDGERDLASIAAQTGLELITVQQLAYGLIALGVARCSPPDADAPLPAADEVSSPHLVGETDLAIDRQRVMAKFALVNEADYFALLGVRRDATSFEIKRAYQAARRDYAGERFPTVVRRELSDQIGEINELLEEAYLVLRDEELRASYLANLRD